MLVQFVLLLALSPPIAWGSPIAHPFYDEKARGWFWKESPPKEPVIAEDPSAPKAQDLAPPPHSKPEDIPLSSAWFRAHLGTIRDEALDDPSPEKVRRFFIVQKALLDKAERFSISAQSVVLQDPELDERSHHPTTPLGLTLSHQVHQKQRQEALKEIARKAGLLFIFRSDCPYCHLMAPLVEALSERITMRLYPVSLDGGEIPGLHLNSVIKDPLLGQKLKLSATPALFLMVPQRGLYPVLEGSASALELEAHLYEAGHNAGLITKASLER